MEDDVLKKKFSRYALRLAPYRNLPNIHADDQHKVDDERLWPSDITVRKYVSKDEWERERPQPRRRLPRQRYQQGRYNTAESSAYDEPDERDSRYRSYAYRDGRHKQRHYRSNPTKNYNDSETDYMYSRDKRNSDDGWHPESRY